MKQMRRKALSFFVALVMVISVLPIMQSNAATYFNFTDYSTDVNSPTQVNTDTIEVKGTYTGVTSDTIQLKVELIVNGQIVSENSNAGVSPLLEGANGFRFANIKLYAGLNKITVSGNTSGTTVSGSAYVYYPNVPTIYDIRLVDTRLVQADKPTVVTTPTVTLMFKAPNATSVTVQGKSALNGGGDTYLISDIALQNGSNTLVFTAANDTMTYSITRDIVLYTGAPTASNVTIENPSGTPAKTSLEGNPTVGPNFSSASAGGERLEGYVTGYLFVEKQPAAALSLTSIDIENSASVDVTGSPSVPTVTWVEDISVTGAVYDFALYKFSSPVAAGSHFSINTKDDYRLYVQGSYGTTAINYPLAFKYRGTGSPIIEEVRQLYNVTPMPAPAVDTYSYTSSSLFADNLVFFQAPIWVAVKAKNFDPSTDTATLTTTQGGAVIGSPAFTYEKSSGGNYRSTNGELVFKITNLPAGEQTLNFTINRGGETDTKDVMITFIPTPFIEFTNMYNGKIYENADYLTTVDGRIVNFNLTAGSPDLSSVQITINGTTRAVTIDPATGAFSFNTMTGPTTWDPALRLIDGPNNIAVSGTANGVPVTTSITVYLFTKDLPNITSIKPVPVGLSADPDNKFSVMGQLQYTTNEKTMDILLSVVNATQVLVRSDGQQNNTATYNSVTGTWSFAPDSQNPLTMAFVSTLGSETTFRLSGVALPAAGTKSITISSVKGTATASQTLQVTRIRVPYSILSPKLPDERVINQNFMKVSIQAEGADQIILGKEQMVKGTDDIFRLNVNNLKNGNNTFKFSIITGDNKADSQFTVTYAAKSEVGAQFKTAMPSSGKLAVFNGDLNISFPKGTLLKKPENKSLANTPPIDLFNNQQLMIGIADPTDGRTVKKYNRVGELVANVPQDGTIIDIPPVAFATNILQASRAHFGYASDLYWIDAGYFVPGSLTYATVDGMHPYVAADPFYVRGQNPDKWMVPTERGTITIKYDPGIRNETANNLSIWRFSNNAWQNLGGIVSTSKKTVSAAFDGFGYYAVFSVRYGYDDITGHKYARNHLDSMFAKGIMQPKPNSNLFGVYDNITRGEFATMVVRMLDLPLNYDTNQIANTFSDVPAFNIPGSLWDYRHIETAARAGIISGLGPRTFNPGGFLTREQAAVIIARAMNIKIGDPDKDLNALSKQFIDAGQIDYYARSHVLAITKAKIMNGQPNPLQEGQKKPTFSFNPKANLNRADMAIISYNVMKKLKKI